MDAKRELELQFHIAARGGDMEVLTRCMDAGVDIECCATDEEMDQYIESLNVEDNQDNNDQDNDDQDDNDY
jgi:hypothetical protein